MNEELESKLDGILEALIENAVRNAVFSYVNHVGTDHDPGSREQFRSQLVGAACTAFEAQLLGIARAYETIDADIEYERSEIRAMVERRSGRVESAVDDLLDTIESKVGSTDPLSDIESGIEDGSADRETEIFDP